MKTAEELFDKYKTSLIVERYFDKHSVIMKAVLEEHFKEALTEYRESIAKMIDEMIRDKFELSKKSTVIDEYEYQILALTELKEKLISKKAVGKRASTTYNVVAVKPTTN